MTQTAPVSKEQTRGFFDGIMSPIYQLEPSSAIVDFDEYTDEEIEAKEDLAEIVELADTGWYDDEPEDEPDTWPIDKPEVLSDAELMEWSR